MTDDLMAWLLEQIAEDERDLNENTDWDHWMIKPSLIAARMRRIQHECDAKRRTVLQCLAAEVDQSADPVQQAMQRAERSALLEVLKRSAAVYAMDGRPGYREEWRP